MRDVVIVGAARTAIGKFGGTLANVPAAELGACVIREALRRAGIASEDAGEVFMGHVIQAGQGLNTARQAALRAGLPETVPACTVNMVCASGMKAIALGARSVATGENDIVVAGGMENMSAAPFLLPQARWGYRQGDGVLADSILSDALTDPTGQCHMGVTAENLADDFKIGRREQDEFAVESQRKAGEAIAAGRFKTEIVPVDVPQKKGPPSRMEADEYPRPQTTVEVLATLKPAFKKDGTVTAGNASGINDGAAAVVLVSAEEARRRGLAPLARIVSSASAGVDPSRMGLGPVPATRRALAQAGLKIEDIDAVELNEAFAVQALAVVRSLGMDAGRVNLNGGAIALGHPVGASGARIVVTLLHIMAERRLRRGLATLCVGGGQGMAMILDDARR